MSNQVNSNSFISYFLPGAKNHHAITDFKKLSHGKRFAVLLASFFASVIPVFGTCAAFRKMTQILKPKGTEETVDKLASKRFDTQQTKAPAQSSPAPSLPKTLRFPPAIVKGEDEPAQIQDAIKQIDSALREEYALGSFGLEGEPPEQLQKLCDQVVLFQDISASKSQGEILGTYDVLVTPAEVTFNNEYDYDPTGNPFLVFHAVESLNLDRFNQNGTFNEALFLDHQRKVISNILKAQEALGIEESVWPPFGFDWIKNELAERPELAPLRLEEKCAQLMLEEMANRPSIQFHLFLPSVEADHPLNQAFQKLEGSKKGNLTIHQGENAIDGARYTQDKRVGVVNPTLATQIGSDWHREGIGTGGFERELHRRSKSAAAMSFVMNRAVDSSLQDNVQRLGGNVRMFADSFAQKLQTSHPHLQEIMVNQLSTLYRLSDWECYNILRSIPGIQSLRFQGAPIADLIAKYKIPSKDLSAFFANAGQFNRHERLNAFLTDENFVLQNGDYDLDLEQLLGADLRLDISMIESKYPKAYAIISKMERFANNDIDALLQKSRTCPEILPALRELILSALP